MKGTGKRTTTKGDSPAPLVFVEWEDSVSVNSGWNNGREIRSWGRTERYMIHQAGYLVAETARYLVLATQYNPGAGDKYSGLHKIPRTWIRKRVRLKT